MRPVCEWVGCGIVNALVAPIPGVGPLYQGVEEMSSMLLDSDASSFRDVKLVEFPHEGAYALAFLTAKTADVVEESVDTEEMVTVFLPLAPNPIMGGYVLHVASDRVYDVDMTVEEGLQSIVTSGVVTATHPDAQLSTDMRSRIEHRLNATGIIARIEDLEKYAVGASSKLSESARESMPTPSGVNRPNTGDPANSDDENDTENRRTNEK